MVNFWLRYSIFKYNRFRNTTYPFCKAPYSSLFFDYKGNVFSCFANKQLCLGNYEHQTINEIWAGKPIKKLRKSIEEYSFNEGCHLCKNKVLQHQFSQVYARRYDYLSLPINDFPANIEVQLSNQCNLRCIMCVVKTDKKSAINIGYFRNYLKDIIPYLKNASFSGGEPFLIEEYFDIWEDFYLLNKDCRISVNTNATLLTDKVKEILKKLPFNISVSVDGYSKETFEQIRHNASRDLVYRNLDYFKQYTQEKQTYFNVKICALQQNIYEFPELFNYFNQQNVAIMLNEVVYPLHTALWNLHSSKIKEILTFLTSHDPYFLNTYSNHHNQQTWKELIKLVYRYFRDAEQFEAFLKKSKRNINSLKEKTVKKILPVFANHAELTRFLTTLERFAQTEKELTTLYLFFMIAPFDRMIGEIEIRNESEIRLIVENIITFFKWK